MRRLPLAFFALLGGASLIGLAIAWGINVTLYGRPHGALLQLIAATAASGIDCERPEHSPLFQSQGALATTPHNLHYVLVDAEGHHLGKRGHIPDGLPGVASTPDKGLWRDQNPWRANSIWVEVPQLCGRNWSLWAWDPNNETYRQLLLPRQIILVLSCSSSIIFVVLLAYLFARRKGREARQVLAKIREGAFGSRITQLFWEPRLSLIDEFNRMAMAVEESFTQLHHMEERRARLLSELAHDVRTPLASLRAAAETLNEFHSTISAAQRQSLLQTLMLDAVYFQSLIDDLLILAQIDRLDTVSSPFTTDIKALLSSVWQRMVEPYPQLKHQLQWPDPCPAQIIVPGDEKLIRRLLQNTLENAFHCARTYVVGQVRCRDNTFCLEVSNDAQVLSDEDLQNWGHKRRQRIITEKAGQPHTSLGLGSSIIVGVSRHLGGHARIEQILTERELISQVSVFIDLPWLDRSTKISD